MRFLLSIISIPSCLKKHHLICGYPPKQCSSIAYASLAFGSFIHIYIACIVERVETSQSERTLDYCIMCLMYLHYFFSLQHFLNFELQLLFVPETGGSSNHLKTLNHLFPSPFLLNLTCVQNPFFLSAVTSIVLTSMNLIQPKLSKTNQFQEICDAP